MMNSPQNGYCSKQHEETKASSDVSADGNVRMRASYAHCKPPRHPTLRPHPPSRQARRPRTNGVAMATATPPTHAKLGRPSQARRQSGQARCTKVSDVATSLPTQARQPHPQNGVENDTEKRVRVYEWTLRQMEKAAKATQEAERRKWLEEEFMLRLSTWRSVAKLRNLDLEEESDESDREEWNRVREQNRKVGEKIKSVWKDEGLVRIGRLNRRTAGVWERVRLL